MALTPCKTETNQKGMELAQHGTGLFPIACYHDVLTGNPVAWHWHTELEVGVIIEGAAVIAAGTKRLIAKQGEGFFINSSVLHAAWEQGTSGCQLHSVVFHPRLVGGSVDSIFWQNYIQPLIVDEARQSIHLNNSRPWHAQAIRAINRAWESCVEELPGYDLQVRGALSQFVFLLSQNRPAAAKVPPDRAIRDEIRVKQMLQFIQENYAEEINTTAIASSAAISESECLRCFRNTIGTAPIQYLRQFRVQKAAERLLSSQESVAEIGAQCGFQNASYFTKTFHELKGCTPSEYQKGWRSGSRTAVAERRGH